MRTRWIAAVPLLFFALGVSAQDSAEDRILKKVDEALKQDRERLRKDILDIVKDELSKLGKKQETKSGDVERALDLVTVDLLKKHIGTLASDEYEGRNAGYPGNDKAADYVAEQFKKAGLKPMGDDGTYLQHFEFQSFYTGSKKLKTQNVVGLLEGSDDTLKKEIVVVGGHFDHVGKESQGRHLGRLGGKSDDDEIWNGADDNASGSSTVMALAKAFGEGKIRTRRSILFMAFSAEEAGLYGSQWYCDHPTAGRIGDHVFMLNLDMVGRNPTKPVEIKGMGSAKGGVIRKAVEEAIAKTGLKAKLDEGGDIMGGDSDHSSFKNKGVPYAFFFTGFHADYHRVTDHADRIAYDHVVTIARTSAHILIAIADRDERLTGPKTNFGDPDPGTQRSARRLGVTVTNLDPEELDDLGLDAKQGGLKIDTVNDGAAKAAGVESGDVVLSLNGRALGRGDAQADLRKALADLPAAKDVDLVVLRKGEKKTLKARWDK